MTCHISEATIKLFERASDEMSAKELDEYSNLIDTAQFTADGIAAMLTVHANLLASDDANGPDDWQLSQILYAIADQARNISGLLQIGLEAEYLARKKSVIEVELSENERAILNTLAEKSGLHAETFAGSLILLGLRDMLKEEDRPKTRSKASELKN